VAGLEWILANAQRPAIANLSLGTDADELFDAAVEALVEAGIPAVVAASNENRDACLYSPGRVPEAITVGGTTMLDRRTSSSNFGACVDWYAPGYLITSAGHLSDVASLHMSGTSMAAPHTSGAAALFLEQNRNASPNTVRVGLSSRLTTGAVDTRVKGHKWGDLLYSLGTEEAIGSAPISDFGFACTDLTCEFTDRSADTDGQVVAWAWDFGAGSQSSARNPSYTFGAPGTYTVTLTVTDNDGLTGTTSKAVTVALTPEGIQLSALGYKVKGQHRIDLSWSGAGGTQVDVYRDGQRVAVTSNSGSYTDAPGSKGNRTYVYKVCEAGSSVCSPNVSVTP
jgi:PKD repeat protein